MGDADDQSCKNDDPAPEAEDQYHNDALQQTHLLAPLPYTNLIIENSERLKIIQKNVSKLPHLYDRVKGKRLPSDQLKTYKTIFCDLHNSYSGPLNYYLPPDVKTSWIQETKLNGEKKKLSANVRCICNKSNQNQNNSSEPVIKTNEKNTDIKTSVAGISVPRDPRLRNKTLLISKNNGSAFNTPASLIPNEENSNTKLVETRAQVYYDGQSSSNHTNIQLLNPKLSSKYNGNSIQFKNRPSSQNQKNNHNNDNKNDYNQFNNSTQIHVNRFHIEPLKRYCDPMPYIPHSNGASKRDSRTFKSVQTTLNSNYKEYRKSNNGEQNKDNVKNKTQVNHAQDQYLRLVNEKMGKKNIMDSSYYSYGSLIETANIKNFKIPKVKHNKALNDSSTLDDSELETFTDNKNNTDVLRTEENSKIHFKDDTIKEQYLVDGQKSELKNRNKSMNDPKVTDKINESHTDKNLVIEITKNSKRNGDLKIKTSMMNNKSKKYDSSTELNLEEITVNIPRNINKEELDSESAQNSILMNHADQKMPKKQKMDSKKKEFDRTVADATENLNDDVWIPKSRTTSTVMKKEKVFTTLNVNNSKPTFEKDATVRNCKQLELGECSKNLDNVSIPNLNAVSRQIEVGHNIIPSLSKEQSGIVNYTTTKIIKIMCKSQAENIVYSETDNKSIVNEEILGIMLKNPGFVNFISSLLQDGNKFEQFNKLLDTSDDNINDDKLKEKDTLFREQLELNKGNTNSGNIDGLSLTDQHKLKSKKSYGNFEIHEDKSNPEEELKIDDAKLDEHIKRNENCNSNILSNDKQTNIKPINVRKAQEIKPKKPFVGPLSVKLARQKMEMERKNSLNELDIKNQLEFENNKVRKGSKSVDGFDEKGKLNSETLTRPITDQSFVSIAPFQIPKQFDDETNYSKPVELNSNTSTSTVKKQKIRKARLSEVEKLHADISKMFGFDAVLYTSKKRQCRTNKQIDYKKTNVGMSEKKKTSNIKQLDTNDDQINFIHTVEKPKNTKNNVKKSTIKLNTKKQFVKKSTINKTLPPIVRATVLNKMSNKQPDELNKRENGNKTFKKLFDSQLEVVLYDEFKFNNVSKNKISTEITSITVTENKFKDKFIEQNTDEIAQESIIDKSPLELSIHENLPDLSIDTNSPELSIESVIHANPPVSAYDKTLPESNMLNFLAKQANPSPTTETRICREQPEIDYSKYTLKEKFLVLAGLSCELINSKLLFKCSISNCLEIQFSTVIFIEFFEHINKNHQFVLWDGKCEACNHKLPIVPGQYYVRNALEHLILHHLVPKNNEEHPNTIGSKTEGLSSLCQYKKSQRVKNSLRVRCLPGDRLSIHEPSSSGIANILCGESSHESPSDGTSFSPTNDFIKNNMFKNSEQSSHNILLDNQCQTSVNPNINHGFNDNDERFPLLSLQISDVKSLRKGKVNASKINSSASNNDCLNMLLEAKTNCEVVLPNSKIFLEAGQQIVNNGVPTDGTFFRLVNTAYTKDYNTKLQDFLMNVMKTRSAFKKMSTVPRLLGLFKCMEKSCTHIFSSKESFKEHLKIHLFSNARRKKKTPIYKNEQCKMCAYCFKVFDDVESLANHITEKYTFCEYFCPHCFYRAYTASHVLVHQSVVHTNVSKNYIIKLDNGACQFSKEMLLVVDFNKFVLPYKCNIGCCGFSCYLLNEFVEHLNQEHQQCDEFCCYICANNEDTEVCSAVHPTLIITHFTHHNINKYQCIYCLFGSGTIDLMIKHLAFEHFEYELLCLERSTISANCESKNIRNLKILRLKKVIDYGMVKIENLPVEIISLPEVLPRRSRKRFIECPAALSVPMKYARIDEGSQPSDVVVNRVPDSALMAGDSRSMSLAIDDKLIKTDDVDDKYMKITRVWSESNDKKKEPNMSSNDDFVLSAIGELDKDSKNQKCLVVNKSIIELDKLFVCKECNEVFSLGDLYFAHLKVCPFWDYVAGRKCMYCVKVYKTASNLTEHIKLHGPDRFECYLCNLRVPSQRAIRLHMKNSHRITNIDYVPEHPDLTDLNKDDFIVLEDKIVKRKITRKQPNNTKNFVSSLRTQQNTSLKRKHCSTDFGDQKGSLKTEVVIKNE